MISDEPPRSDLRSDTVESVEGLRALLTERDALIQRTSATVSHTRHELNNLLTGILGQAQLTIMREELTPGARRRIEALEGLARRMKDTIAELNSI